MWAAVAIAFGVFVAIKIGNGNPWVAAAAAAGAPICCPASASVVAQEEITITSTCLLSVMRVMMLRDMLATMGSVGNAPKWPPDVGHVSHLARSCTGQKLKCPGPRLRSAEANVC